MPWRRSKLREQVVYARVTEQGDWQAEDGSVEIRYRPSDGRKYQARAANLTALDDVILPDHVCAEAKPVERASSPGAPSSGASGQPVSSARASSPGRPALSPAKAAAKANPTAVPDGAIVAYTDGACSGNPGPAGVGMVLLDGERRAELSEYLGAATNNIAELTAVLRAVERAADSARPLVVHTDSQYAIGVLTKGWKAKANTELILRIRQAIAARPGVRLVYVPGHAGVPLNERADELARLAITCRKTQDFAGTR